MPLFAPATRQKAKLRMALTGVSGGGKTLGALYIAYGITGDWSKVALIDTEHERARFYSGRADLGVGVFLYAPLDPPYSPDRYKDYVTEASNVVGPDGVVIIDSLSHAWNNEGGVLEIKDKIAAGSKETKFSAWNEAGKLQNSLINTILAVPSHTIVTMRSKMEYMIDETTKKVHKVGLAPVQRDDTEYEFDIVLDLGRDHTVTVSKDTTILQDGTDVITPELGSRLAEWLASGADEALTCEDCGATIAPAGACTARRVADTSLARFGRKLCAACTRKANAEKKAAKKEPADAPPTEPEMEITADQAPEGTAPDAGAD